MIHDRSKIVFARLRAGLVALATLPVAFFASASLSPYSVTQVVSASPGVSTHTIADVSPFDALISRPVSTSVLNAAADGSVTVRAASKVATNYGPVDATAVRSVSWANLLKPWKKVLKAVPVIGNGLTIYELLNDLCIRPVAGSVGEFEECTTTQSETVPVMMWPIPGSAPVDRSAIESYLKSSLSSTGFGTSLSCSTYASYPFGNLTKTQVMCQGYASSSATPAGAPYQAFSTSLATCDGDPQKVQQRLLPNGTYFYYCNSSEITGYSPVPQSYVDNKIDNYSSSKPGRLPDVAPRLFDDLTKVPKELPQDHQTVEPSSPTSVTGPTSKPGPSTTETTPDGQKVTTGGATITYNGDTSTVVHNTTTTYINNEGDVTNTTNTTEQAPTDCEVNPSAVACQELGDPGEGDIPKSDQNWSITPESLPGGFCPAGFVFPITGTPSFSWQPLCDNLPAARAVIILLSAVIAAWIVAGALKS